MQFLNLSSNSLSECPRITNLTNLLELDVTDNKNKENKKKYKSKDINLTALYGSLKNYPNKIKISYNKNDVNTDSTMLLIKISGEIINTNLGEICLNVLDFCCSC